MREIVVKDHTYRHDGTAWRLIGGAREPVCGPRISALLDALAACTARDGRTEGHADE